MVLRDRMGAVDLRRRPVRVLLVEDNDLDAMLVARALQRALPEATMNRVHDVDAACRVLAQGTTDIALVDWRLPDGLGEEVAIRGVALAPDVPVVLMSKGTACAETQGLRGTATAFVSKEDLTPEQLRNTVETALRKAAESGRPTGP